MSASRFVTESEKRILVLDGSMGALLQGRGLPAGMAPDVWMMENPDVIYGAHKEYRDAGADILLTNTFGASRWRLAEYQAEGRIREINAKAVEIARRAAGPLGFVAGDIGPSGETVYPTGNRPFDQVCEIFYEQAKILVELGVDLIVVETLFDSLEMRAALSGIRAASSLMPVIAHATFNTDGITDTGASPENIAAIAEGFHCQAVGVNCSTGPDPMVEIVRRMARVSRLKICVQPNAGLPVLREGRTQFPMTPNDMAPYVDRFVEAGASIIGGCCGTTPEYIRQVAQKTKGLTDFRRGGETQQGAGGTLLSSMSGFARLGGGVPFLPIGERMNPSGRKKLSESLKRKDLTGLLEDAEKQVKAGGLVLDLNVGVPLVDEPALMRDAVVAIQNKFPKIPLMIDSANAHALDKGSQVYYGRPLLNSINAEDERLEEMLPIVKKHGAAIVCMTTGVMVPVDPMERLKNAQKIVDLLVGKHGFREEDLVFDCLGLVVSAMRDGSKATLKTIQLVKEAFPGAATTLGLSNVSFGLPNRVFVHTAFLAQAIGYGLDSAIMSVTEPLTSVMAGAAEMWGPKEDAITAFIERFSDKVEIGTGATPAAGGETTPAVNAKTNREPDWLSKKPALDQAIFRSIVEGQKDAAIKAVTEFSEKTPELAMTLFIEVMTPAIRHLGDLFAARLKFIPHLIAAAESMKAGVAILEPLLLKARAASGAERGTVIFATVKGDIHDIGKNICILMLKNFGYNVIDLGRNVSPDTIFEEAAKHKTQVIALSALMTTTMMQMKVIIDRVRAEKLPYKVVIGGAVVTPEFAREIQADGFSTDVGTVVSEMERVLAILAATDALQKA